MQFRGVYVVRLDAVSVSAARTLIQVSAAAATPLVLLRGWCSFASNVNTQIELRLKKVTTAGTGTSFTLIRLNGHTTPGASASVNHTAEGTLGDTLWREYANYVGPGWQYLPVPEERITVAGGERLALDLPTAPGAAVTISAGLVVAELG